MKKLLAAFAVFFSIVLIVFLHKEGTLKKKPGDNRAKKAEVPSTTPFTDKIGMKFVYIPPGSFMMGSPREEPGRYGRELLHKVILSRGFYMQTTEVTQAQWKAVMRNNPSCIHEDSPDFPVEKVSWNDAKMFIRKLNRMDSGRRYRLPTEAEWEYSCRAGTTTLFNWGDTADCSKANYGVTFIHRECKGQNPGRPVETASFPPNSLGLYDMHGNVWEWCQDRFGSYSPEKVTDPHGSYSNPERVLRGGGWDVPSRFCRSANRDGAYQGKRDCSIGFRVAANY